jgi:hypothetical protein
MALGLGVPVSVRDNPGRLEIVRVECAGLYDRVAESVAETLSEPGSIGVIVPEAATEDVSKALSRNGVEHGVLGANHGDLDHQVDVVPAPVAKGLEFDRVTVVEPSAIAAADPDPRTGLRRLYVVLTRAVSELTVFHSEELLLSWPADGLTGATITFELISALWPIHLTGVGLFGGSPGLPAGGRSTVAVSGRRKARGRLGACGAL